MHHCTRLGLLVAVFALLGAGRAVAQEKTAAPAAVTPAAIAKGDSIFHKDGLCYACHGSNAEGVVGPNLTDAEWLHGDGSYDFIVATVTSGIPAEKAKKGVADAAQGWQLDHGRSGEGRRGLRVLTESQVAGAGSSAIGGRTAVRPPPLRAADHQRHGSPRYLWPMTSNRLAHAASAYLQSAAHQPIHWYPLG